MKSLRSATTLSLATATAILFSTGAAMADSGSNAWPAGYPLPLGTVVAQTSDAAVVRSADAVIEVKAELDALYVDQLGCTRVVAVNKPRDYLCSSAATGKTDEVWFTFAALDPTAGDASRSQTNAYLADG